MHVQASSWCCFVARGTALLSLVHSQDQSKVQTSLRHGQALLDSCAKVQTLKLLASAQLS